MDYPFEYISVAVDDGLAAVRFSVPVTDSEEFVANSHPMHAELRDVWPRLGFDPEVRAAIVTGTGDTFYVGPGLAEVAALIRRQPYSARQLMQESREIVTNLINFAKPLVAAVNGPAIGMGVQMAFLADSLVAYRDGSFHDTHVRVGLGAGDGGTMMWPLLIGLARSRRLLLRGHPLSAAGGAGAGAGHRAGGARPTRSRPRASSSPAGSCAFPCTRTCRPSTRSISGFAWVSSSPRTSEPGWRWRPSWNRSSWTPSTAFSSVSPPRSNEPARQSDCQLSANVTTAAPEATQPPGRTPSIATVRRSKRHAPSETISSSA